MIMAGPHAPFSARRRSFAPAASSAWANEGIGAGTGPIKRTFVSNGAEPIPI
jgi:hypothetical protein